MNKYPGSAAGATMSPGVLNSLRRMGGYPAGGGHGPVPVGNKPMAPPGGGLPTMGGHGPVPVGNKVMGQSQATGNTDIISQLQALLQQQSGPVDQTGLRFNPAYADAFRNLDRSQVAAQTQAQSGRNQMTENYQRSVSDNERLAQAARRALSSRMADSGILHSGVNVGARSDLNTDFIRQLGDMSNQYASGNAGIENNLADAMSQLQSSREGLRFGQARDEVQSRLGEEQQRSSGQAQIEYLIQLLSNLNGVNGGPGLGMSTGYPKPNMPPIGAAYGSAK